MEYPTSSWYLVITYELIINTIANFQYIVSVSLVTFRRSHLTHWGRMTHICVSNLTIIVSDNGLSPGRRQAIIWTNAGIWLIGPLGINFSEILIGIQTFSFKKMHLKMSSAKWRTSCLGLNVLRLSWIPDFNPTIPQSSEFEVLDPWEEC